MTKRACRHSLYHKIEVGCRCFEFAIQFYDGDPLNNLTWITDPPLAEGFRCATVTSGPDDGGLRKNAFRQETYVKTSDTSYVFDMVGLNDLESGGVFYGGTAYLKGAPYRTSNPTMLSLIR